MKTLFRWFVLFIAVFVFVFVWWLRRPDPMIVTGDSMPSPAVLEKHCKEIVGPPRIEKISKHVWVALGYDLANTVLIQTPKGSVIVDTGSCPKRAKEIRQAFVARKIKVEPVAAIIYTHSHIDHIGGASAWADPKTQIWATAKLPKHLLKQYQEFLRIEMVRGGRQFGYRVPDKHLPCSALGRRVDLESMLESGVLMPTKTFTQQKELDFGGFKLRLVEAHGETHDQLFVWLPSEKTLIAGDNFYSAFPNLYTIRGTSPRPVDEWIRSLDKMRRYQPEHLVPNHTRPLHGKQTIQKALTAYRDAIQWIRDAVVRGANKGLDIDTLAQTIRLPKHLAGLHQSQELYGQIDWSIRAIYTNNLGWFDGRPDTLYPMPAQQAAQREIKLMGGPQKVLTLAKDALASQPRWAMHLLSKLRTSRLLEHDSALKIYLAAAYRAVAKGIFNTNGRAYLLESAIELEKGPSPHREAKLNLSMIESVPLRHIFSIMATRLKPASAMQKHESLVFVFPDQKKRFILTIRRGICEIAEDNPLPNTPQPIAEITLSAANYRKMALKLTSPLSLYAQGQVTVKGSWLNALSFLRRFRL